MRGGHNRIFGPRKTRPRGWDRQLGRSQEGWKDGGQRAASHCLKSVGIRAN